MTPQTLLQEQMKEFGEKFPNNIAEVVDDFGSTVKTDILEWHKQSIKQILQAEVERLTALSKDHSKEDWHINWTHHNGYREALTDQITHLSQIIDTL